MSYNTTLPDKNETIISKEEWQSRLEEYKIKQSDMNRLIMNYLVTGKDICDRDNVVGSIHNHFRMLIFVCRGLQRGGREIPGRSRRPAVRRSQHARQSHPHPRGRNGKWTTRFVCTQTIMKTWRPMLAGRTRPVGHPPGQSAASGAARQRSVSVLSSAAAASDRADSVSAHKSAVIECLQQQPFIECVSTAMRKSRRRSALHKRK